MPKEKYTTKRLLFAIIIPYYLLNTLIFPEVMISQGNMILFKITGKKIYFLVFLNKFQIAVSKSLALRKPGWLSQLSMQLLISEL